MTSLWLYVESERREDKGESRVRIVSVVLGVCLCASCDFLIKMSAYNPDNLGLANKIILWDFQFQSSVSMVSFLSKEYTIEETVPA